MAAVEQSPQRTRRLQRTFAVAIAASVLLVLCSTDDKRRAAPATPFHAKTGNWTDRVVVECAERLGIQKKRVLDQADIVLMSACYEGARAGKAATNR